MNIKRNRESLPVQPSFRLLSIGVVEKMKGKGIASLLVTSFEEIACQHSDNYGLSVHGNNLRAINFYKKMGFLYSGKLMESFYYMKAICCNNKEK